MNNHKTVYHLIRFLQPIALTSIAALLLPLLVHLWHRRKGKTVKVGSIRLFTLNSKQRANNRRIHNWPLFITRCLLVLSIGFLLAKPIYESTSTEAGKNGWVLVDAGKAGIVYRQHSQLMDSLLAAGYSLHAVSPGYPVLTLADSSEAQVGTGVRPWQLLQSLGDSLPAGFPVKIFAAGQQGNFTGNRPQTKLNASITLYKAETSPPDSLLYEVPSADTSTLFVTLIEAKPGDARYIRAALSAMADYTGRRIDMTGNSLIPDILFAAAGSTVLPGNNKARKIFIYPGTAVTGKETMVSAALTPLGPAEPIYVTLTEPADTFPALGIWQGAKGKPALDLTQQGSTSVYRLHSSPDAGGGSLVWNEQFVYALLQLVFPDRNNMTSLMPVDESMIQPTHIAIAGKKTSENKPASPVTRDLGHLAWIILFVLVATERLLAGRKKRTIRE
ncbi:MAG: hypothetical protein EOO09_14470 [Chitinophagaceae bacterium]|nr:MAG: hypothetical protein EOO09_14470 [Chitinophagaceae bacterium]